MEDITEKLSELLNSTDGMDKIKAAAQAILGDTGNTPDSGEMPLSGAETASAANGLSNLSLPQNLLENASNIQGMMRIMNLLQNQKEDSRVQLLMALKPHLSEQRGKRIDRAVSLLKVASLLPVLKEEGLLDSLGL